jgi:hypothetical protein
LRHAVIEILNITQQLANFLILKGFLLRGGIVTNGIIPSLSVLPESYIFICIPEGIFIMLTFKYNMWAIIIFLK